VVTAGSWFYDQGQTGVATVKKRSGKYEKSVTQRNTAINRELMRLPHSAILINALRDARSQEESEKCASP